MTDRSKYSNGNEQRSVFRYVVVWAFGVLQVLTTTAVIAGVGALWALSTTTATLVVEVSAIKADLIVLKLRQEKSETETKRVSDEQIRRGVILEQLKDRRK